MVLAAPAMFANDTTRVKQTSDAVTLTLPQGFTSVTIADGLGSNRHIAVNTNGDIYVKLERLKDGKGIVVLREAGGKYQVVH
jgi:hypothetical protein